MYSLGCWNKIHAHFLPKTNSFQNSSPVMISLLYDFKSTFFGNRFFFTSWSIVELNVLTFGSRWLVGFSVSCTEKACSLFLNLFPFCGWNNVLFQKQITKQFWPGGFEPKNLLHWNKNCLEKLLSKFLEMIAIIRNKIDLHLSNIVWTYKIIESWLFSPSAFWLKEHILSKSRLWISSTSTTRIEVLSIYKIRSVGISA